MRGEEVAVEIEDGIIVVGEEEAEDAGVVEVEGKHWGRHAVFDVVPQGGGSTGVGLNGSALASVVVVVNRRGESEATLGIEVEELGDGETAQIDGGSIGEGLNKCAPASVVGGGRDGGGEAALGVKIEEQGMERRHKSVVAWAGVGVSGSAKGRDLGMQ